MKYFSEKTNKSYDTEKECINAEKQFDLEQKEKEKKVSEVSKRKKELANRIEEAEKKISEANKLYDIAKETATSIINEANKKAKELLTNAQEELKKAGAEKFNAVREFNKEFGTYTTTITGEKAAEDFEKIIRHFNNIFDTMFWL